ncbi:MAG: L-threonylcarbamoyladenylate synthase [Bacteroidota bacterium]
MRTLYTTSPAPCAALLQRGGLVAFPTETVYGLGASVHHPEALARVFAAKGRPPDNPLIVHLAHPDQLAEVAEVDAMGRSLAETLMPGPCTLVVARHPRLDPAVTAGRPTVGVRIPDHPVAQAFLRACGVPVAAPSANRSGRPSATTWQAVQADLDGRIEAVLQGEASTVGVESTVIDVTGAAPIILRPGAVSLEQIQALHPSARMYRPDDPLERSPGTRYRHYAPRAHVVVHQPGEPIPTPSEAGYIGLHRPPEASALGLLALVDDEEAYAQRLFAFFRTCDARGLARIYGEAVPARGLGRAIMDRLTRAAAGR